MAIIKSWRLIPLQSNKLSCLHTETFYLSKPEVCCYVAGIQIQSHVFSSPLEAAHCLLSPGTTRMWSPLKLLAGKQEGVKLIVFPQSLPSTPLSSPWAYFYSGRVVEAMLCSAGNCLLCSVSICWILNSEVVGILATESRESIVSTMCLSSCHAC